MGGVGAVALGLYLWSMGGEGGKSESEGMQKASNDVKILLRVPPGEGKRMGLTGGHLRESVRGMPWMVAFDGPIRPEWRQAVENAGAKIFGYLPENTYLAMMPTSARQAVEACPHVVWSGEYLPECKVHPRLLEKAISAHGDGEKGEVYFQTFAAEDAPALARRLEGRGAREVQVSTATGSQWGLVCARLTPHEAIQWAREPEVCWVEEGLHAEVCNDRARTAAYLNVEPVQNTYSLDGTGQVVAVADTGLDTGDETILHPDFEGRLLAVIDTGRGNDWSDPTYHGTHVAASVVGTGAASAGQFCGVAPGAKLVFHALLGSSQTLVTPNDLNELYAPAYEWGARIHSGSWGFEGYNDYRIYDQNTDEFIWNHPDFLVVFSAGNDGCDANRDGVVDGESLRSPGIAKNVLTVGAAEGGRAAGMGGRTSSKYSSHWSSCFPSNPIAADLISSSPDGEGQGMAAFSSRGPTADGRNKPDVVAPGTDVISARSRASDATGWGIYSANTNYCFMGGSSMAAPLVSGCAVLLRQYAVERLGVASPSAAFLKAALVGGARSLSPGQYGTNALHREIPPPPRPNAAEGYGQVDVGQTLFPSNGLHVIWREGDSALSTGEEQRYTFTVATTNRPLVAVMAYSDYPALPSAAKMLVNDLDMALLAPDGTVHRPGNRAESDHKNNVEAVDVAVAVTGEWTVVISATNVPQGPQPFAFYLRGDIHTPPTITHEPLQNQSSTTEVYRVVADIAAEGGWDVDSAHLFYQVDAGETFSLPLVPQTASPTCTTYYADIPGQPLGAAIQYWLSADAVSCPVGAPEPCFRFSVTRDVEFTVSGEPGTEPVTHVAPSGTVLRLSTALTFPGTNESTRFYCLGWQGTGSIPTTGTTPFVEFTLVAPSTLCWRWQTQYLLTQTASPALIPDHLAWVAVGSSTASESVPEWIRVASTNDGEVTDILWVFAEWLLDDTRWPTAPLPAPLQVSPLLMDRPHSLQAIYKESHLDSDASGLPDWFEDRYFAARASPSDDPDGDAWENAIEAADHTHPLDASSMPAAPVITHTPVTSPCTNAFPLLLAADITDNFRVASAVLNFSRNGQAARSIAMIHDSGSCWSVQTPILAADGDAFVYSFTATDEAGLVTRTSNYTFTLSYPRLQLSPAEGFHVELATNRQAVATLSFENAGSWPLQLSMEFAPAGYFDDAESGTNGWTRSADHSQWHLGQMEYYSSSNAWTCAWPDTLPAYVCDADDSLISPPLRLWPSNAPGFFLTQLTFYHRATFECDHDQATNSLHYWDSGILEVSFDEGTSWTLLIPQNGYPANITPNEESPFDPETPCFATTPSWEPVTVPLPAPPTTTNTAARIRFRFGSDSYVVDAGWRIDDIEITPRTQYPGTSTNWATLSTNALSISPSAAGSLQVTFDKTGFEPCQADVQYLLIHHNDPLLPSPFLVPLSLRDARRRLGIVASGPGTVSPTGEFEYPAETNILLVITPEPGNIIADFQRNQFPDASICGTDQPRHLNLLLTSNLEITVQFAAPAPADQIPDADWLGLYGLINRPPSAEAALDPDGDGLLTWQEAELGSSPIDSSSAPLYLRLLPPTGDDTNWRVTWQAFTNTSAHYLLLSTTNLTTDSSNPSAEFPFQPVTNLPAIPPTMTSPPLPPPSLTHPFYHAIRYHLP